VTVGGDGGAGVSENGGNEVMLKLIFPPSPETNYNVSIRTPVMFPCAGNR